MTQSSHKKRGGKDAVSAKANRSSFGKNKGKITCVCLHDDSQNNLMCIDVNSQNIYTNTTQLPCECLNTSSGKLYTEELYKLTNIATHCELGILPDTIKIEG